MPSPRSATLIAVMTVLASSVASPSTGNAETAARPATAPAIAPATAPVHVTDSAKDPASLTQLRRQAQQAYKRIEEATRTLTARQKTFDASQRALVGKLGQLNEASQKLARLRGPLSELVEYLYQDPSLIGLGPMVAGPSDADGSSLRAMSDVNHLVDSRSSVLADASLLLKEQERLANEAEELRAANLLQEAQLNVEIDGLRQKSHTLVKSLTQALTKLGVKVNQGNRGASACDPTRVDLTAQYPNGLLPKTSLCPLPQRGEELRADAAIAFADLNIAYKKRFGQPICISDSYRSLGAQQAVYYQKPGMAAIPGRSNHGFGLALDLCGGIQSFRSVQFNWMEANSKRYGFIHPDWSYHSPFEPWHWEYDPAVGNLL